MKMKCEWNKRQWKEGEWLTQFCCSAFHTCFHSPFWESSAMQQCVTHLLSRWSHIHPLADDDLRPPLPLCISPCRLPLPLSAQCSTANCVFCSLLPLHPLAIIHTTQRLRLLVLHCNHDRSWPHWRVSMTLMTIMSSAVLGGHPVGPVGASSSGPRWCASMTSMMIMQQEVTCCSVPIILLCCWTFLHLYCCLVCRVVLLSCLLCRMVEWWHGIYSGTVGGHHHSRAWITIRCAVVEWCVAHPLSNFMQNHCSSVLNARTDERLFCLRQNQRKDTSVKIELGEI